VVEVGAASAVEGALDLELYTANERLPLLAEVLERPVEIRAP
jgi:hypothetical protein